MIPLSITGVISIEAAVSSTLLDSLVSWWEFEEASGTRVDAHGSNDLEPSTNPPTSVPGMYGDALHCVRNSLQGLSSSATVGLQSGDRDFTAAAWVKLDSIGLRQAVLKDSSGWMVSIQSSNNIRSYIVIDGGAQSINVYGTDLLTTGAWHLILCEHDTSANKLGVSLNNGTQDIVIYNTTAYAKSSILFEVGNSSSYEGINGAIENACFWDRLLTTSEKAELYNGGAGVAYGDL